MFSDLDIIHTQSFPENFDFCGRPPKFYCGMSVPPLMTAAIADQIYFQYGDKLKESGEVIV